MNLDELFDNKEIVEKPEEEVSKEEIKEGSTKSVNNGTINCTNLKNLLISDFNGGNDVLYFRAECQSTNSYIYIIDKNSQEYKYTLQLGDVEQNLGNESYYNINVTRYRLFSASDNCIGLDFLRQYPIASGTNCNIETYPKTGQSIDNPNVSGNSIDYTEYLETIIERLEGIEEDVQSISNNIVSAGNGSGDGNNNQIGTVSQNILTTPINEYSLTDGLLVVGLTMGLIVGVILIIRRCIYKWS